jgi:Domain of unknown function (DUF4296)
MKKFLLISLLALGCQSEVFKEKPSLNKNQLVPIVADLRVLESSYALRYQQVDSNVVQLQSYQQAIFDRYQVSKDAVRNSIAYFAAQPDSMKALDSLVMIKLEEKLKTLQNSGPLPQ